VPAIRTLRNRRFATTTRRHAQSQTGIRSASSRNRGTFGRGTRIPNSGRNSAARIRNAGNETVRLNIETQDVAHDAGTNATRFRKTFRRLSGRKRAQSWPRERRSTIQSFDWRTAQVVHVVAAGDRGPVAYAWSAGVKDNIRAASPGQVPWTAAGRSMNTQARLPRVVKAAGCAGVVAVLSRFD